MPRRSLVVVVLLGIVASVTLAGGSAGAADASLVPAGSVLRVNVPEAIGGKTVIGQLTVDRVTSPGFVTAYACDDGIPIDPSGAISRSDLNFDPHASSFASNRLIVKADDNGDVCFYAYKAVAMIVDVNAVTFDTGVNSFANRRVDTRNTATPLVPAGTVYRIPVPEAAGRKTVVGQLTVDRVAGAGFVTAYGCADGIPRDAGGVARSDLNFDANASSVASNRLIVQADANGDLCFYTYKDAALVVDINGVSDTGITSFPNRRTDTRTSASPLVAAGSVTRITVPEAAGHKTVVGQLTVDRVASPGFVTAFACDDGIPTDAGGGIARSDLNFDPQASPFASNRLVVEADEDGDICFYAYQAVALIVDVNAVSGAGISSFPNRRTDTRNGALPEGSISRPNVPVFPPYNPQPALTDVAALTGLPADEATRNRPIVAVKIDNYGQARPQWGLDQADAVIELNVEGISRFIAMFHSQVPGVVGPVRSARTDDVDLLSAMNRPMFAFSGANATVTDWVSAAGRAGVLVDFNALRNGCYARTDERPGPHNLLLDPGCAIAQGGGAGPARPLWPIAASWTTPTTATADSSFAVAMDGVGVGWTWDAATNVYLRSQDGVPHVAQSGVQLSARNVVVIATDYVPSPADARSPHAVTVGNGTAVIHRDGVAVPVEWARSAADQPFTFTDPSSGQTVPLDTGNTFIELERAG